MLAVDKRLWLGYTDIALEGHFIDIEQNSPSISPWGNFSNGSLQPDNLLKNICGKKDYGQHCVVTNFRGQSFWGDVWCCVKYMAACQTKRVLQDAGNTKLQ